MSVPYLLLAPLLLAVPIHAGKTSARGRASSNQSWFVPPHASVYSEPKNRMPQHTTQAVELLRFVTAYKVGVEALVDITPYSALLRASADTDEELTFFAFIDTWVGNNTPETKPVMALDSAGKCTPSTRQQDAWGDGGRQGNGWQIDVDLVFWPRAGAVDTRPRESITISSGYYGGYSIGNINFHEGKVGAGGNTVEFNGGVDFTGAIDAEVYPCPGGVKDAERGVRMGKMAKKAHQLGNDTSSLTSLIDDVYNQLVGDSMAFVIVTSSDPERHEVVATFDPAEVRAEPGMPVYYEKEDVQIVGGNDSFFFPNGRAVGQVTSASHNTATIKITGPCFPGNNTHLLPRLRIEKFASALASARTLADSLATFHKRVPKLSDGEGSENALALLARRKAKEHATRIAEQDADGSVFKPFLVFNRNNEYSLAPVLASVDLGHLGQKHADCAPSMFSLLQTAQHEALDQKKNASTPQIIPGLLGNALAKGSPIATAQRLLAKAGSLGTTGLAAALAKKGEMTLQEGDKVCVLTRRAHGRVFERTFDMPSFFPSIAGAGSTTAASEGSARVNKATGDRVLLQFAVTGHGWSGSTEQCGEFCHAIYHISVNGKQAVNVTEWRDDCERNPINNQLGTWPISRDGWCPGSVEPGLYVDMTKWMQNGRNEIAVDLSVWSSKTGRYQKYTNYGGFGGADGASLFVGATVFVYDNTAVEAIRAQDKAYTAAEAALRVGSSFPKALRPPERVNSRFGDSLLQLSQKSSDSQAGQAKALEQTSFLQAGAPLEAAPVRKHTSLLSQQSRMRPSLQRYDFEEKAPWYLYSEAEAGKPGHGAGASIVPTFKDGLIQINSREIRVKVNKRLIPKEWGQAAVHLRLERPSKEGRTMDNWDRVGSFGIAYEEQAATTKDPNSKVKLRPSKGRKLLTSWKLAKAPVL